MGDELEQARMIHTRLEKVRMSTCVCEGVEGKHAERVVVGEGKQSESVMVVVGMGAFVYICVCVTLPVSLTTTTTHIPAPTTSTGEEVPLRRGAAPAEGAAPARGC